MFVVDEAALRRAAKRYGDTLAACAGDADAMLAEERVDPVSLGMCLSDLATLRGYTQEAHLESLFEGFMLGLLAGRRESYVIPDPITRGVL